jgi:hypothetical protein
MNFLKFFHSNLHLQEIHQQLEKLKADLHNMTICHQRSSWLVFFRKFEITEKRVDFDVNIFKPLILENTKKLNLFRNLLN